MRAWIRDRSGTTAIEYAMIAAIMGITAVLGFGALGGSNGGLWGKVGNAFETNIK
jgi:Flp pilus assembly pilin Flp